MSRTYEVSLDVDLEAVKREHIERVFVDARGNVSETARRLGVSRTTVQRVMRRWARDLEA